MPDATWRGSAWGTLAGSLIGAITGLSILSDVLLNPTPVPEDNALAVVFGFILMVMLIVVGTIYGLLAGAIGGFLFTNWKCALTQYTSPADSENLSEGVWGSAAYGAIIGSVADIVLIYLYMNMVHGVWFWPEKVWLYCGSVLVSILVMAIAAAVIISKRIDKWYDNETKKHVVI